MQTTYEIPAENLPRFQEKFDAIARKAIKLGFEPPTYTIGESYEKLVDRKEQIAGHDVFSGEDAQFDYWEEYVTYHTVTVSGQSPKLDGWRFAITADYAESPVILRALVTDLEIPERYRTCGPICEHCNVKRDRHECCILVHDSGKMIQVGKSCLKDFLGHPSPERLASMAEDLADLDAACRGFAGGSAKANAALVIVLTWANSIVSRHGWIPKSREDMDRGIYSTARQTSEMMAEYEESVLTRKPFKSPLPTAQDFKRAQDAIIWAQNLTGSSEYEQNLKAIASRSGVSRQNWGLAVSIVGSYDREMSKRAEQSKARASEFVGTVGKKINCKCTKKTCKCAPIKVVVQRVIPLPDYGYGSSAINIMTDDAGNALVWKSGTFLRVTSEYMLSGTVKEHDDSKYGKQTVLTRCKAEMIEHDAGSFDVTSM